MMCQDTGGRVDPSGQIITRTTQLRGSFNQLDINVPITVNLVINPNVRRKSLVITGDRSFLPHIRTAVINRVQTIDMNPNVCMFCVHPTNCQLQATITVRNLNALRISGSGFLSSSNPITNRNFHLIARGSTAVQMRFQGQSAIIVEAEGSSQVTVHGTVNSAVLRAQGSSEIQATALNSPTVTAEAAGSSKIHCYAAQYLQAFASGTSQLFYAGNPQVETSVSGMVIVQQTG
ncbi:MAG: DUF2807 domain-containing protein [Gammaproteobacteria bacterium]|nr:DUF2807 domain-containing protein [Gammaproteobacteria bacterium]